MTNVSDEIARLKRMRWSELEKEAGEVGLSNCVIWGAATRDELRLAILNEKCVPLTEMTDA